MAAKAAAAARVATEEPLTAEMPTWPLPLAAEEVEVPQLLSLPAAAAVRRRGQRDKGWQWATALAEAPPPWSGLAPTAANARTATADAGAVSFQLTLLNSSPLHSCHSVLLSFSTVFLPSSLILNKMLAIHQVDNNRFYVLEHHYGAFSWFLAAFGDFQDTASETWV